MTPQPEIPPPSRLQRWIIQPLRRQLAQGTTPQKLAWSISLGAILGTFPIMGTTTALCLLIAHIFKLNQPVAHLFNNITYPLHLPLILVFITLGQHLHGIEPTPLSIPQLIADFRHSPAQFAQDFGTIALHAVQAWAITALLFIPIAYYTSLPLLRKLLRKLNQAP